MSSPVVDVKKRRDVGFLFNGRFGESLSAGSGVGGFAFAATSRTDAERKTIGAIL